MKINRGTINYKVLQAYLSEGLFVGEAFPYAQRLFISSQPTQKGTVVSKISFSLHLPSTDQASLRPQTLYPSLLTKHAHKTHTEQRQEDFTAMTMLLTRERSSNILCKKRKKYDTVETPPL
jgi:hypothetical protein